MRINPIKLGSKPEIKVLKGSCYRWTEWYTRSENTDREAINFTSGQISLRIVLRKKLNNANKSG